MNICASIESTSMKSNLVFWQVFVILVSMFFWNQAFTFMNSVWSFFRNLFSFSQTAMKVNRKNQYRDQYQNQISTKPAINSSAGQSSSPLVSPSAYSSISDADRRRYSRSISSESKQASLVKGSKRRRRRRRNNKSNINNRASTSSSQAHQSNDMQEFEHHDESLFSTDRFVQWVDGHRERSPYPNQYEYQQYDRDDRFRSPGVCDIASCIYEWWNINYTSLDSLFRQEQVLVIFYCAIYLYNIYAGSWPGNADYSELTVSTDQLCRKMNQ